MTALRSATEQRTPRSSGGRPRARLWLTIVSLLVLVVPLSVANAASAADTADVQVFFTVPDGDCDEVAPFDRAVRTPAVLTRALRRLLAGPTAAEASETATLFSNATRGMLESVNLRDGVAHVDFADLRSVIPNASTSCGSAGLLAQLDATVFQFPAVIQVRYSIEGSEEAFYHWLQRDVPGASRVTATRGSLANTDAIRRRRGGPATLRRIRVGTHDGFDRVVFQFQGRRPSYSVSYTGVATKGGSGQPIPLLGSMALQINMGASTVEFVPGFPKTFTPVGPQTPRFPTLRHVRYGSEFEAQAVFGAGVRGVTGFRVLELVDPTRLAIDVAHGSRARLLRQGVRGVDVHGWQEQLNMVQVGFFAVSTTPSVSPLATDGIFGPNTRSATRVFQRAEGAAVDGVVGPETRAAMRRAIREASRISP